MQIKLKFKREVKRFFPSPHLPSLQSSGLCVSLSTLSSRNT